MCSQFLFERLFSVYITFGGYLVFPDSVESQRLSKQSLLLILIFFVEPVSPTLRRIPQYDTIVLIFVLCTYSATCAVLSDISALRININVKYAELISPGDSLSSGIPNISKSIGLPSSVKNNNYRHLVYFLITLKTCPTFNTDT